MNPATLRPSKGERGDSGRASFENLRMALGRRVSMALGRLDQSRRVERSATQQSVRRRKKPDESGNYGGGQGAGLSCQEGLDGGAAHPATLRPSKGEWGDAGRAYFDPAAAGRMALGRRVEMALGRLDQPCRVGGAKCNLP